MGKYKLIHWLRRLFLGKIGNIDIWCANCYIKIPYWESVRVKFTHGQQFYNTSFCCLGCVTQFYKETYKGDILYEIQKGG